MLERIIEIIFGFIGKVISIFGNSLDSAIVSTSLAKEQINSTKHQIVSSVSSSLHEHTLINYFEVKVISEFIQLISSFIEYTYEEKTKLYVAYLVRHRNRTTMEYIKFFKDSNDSSEINITYTMINVLLSKNGVTKRLGTSNDNILAIDGVIANTIGDTLLGTKAPLYYCKFLDSSKEVKLGNGSLVYKAWILEIKYIDRKVNNLIKSKESPEFDKIETILSKAGIHFVMSYFCSLKNPFYRLSYKDVEISSISSLINEYNSYHFSLIKILDIKYDKEDCNVKDISNLGNNTYIIKYMGITLKVTGKLEGNFGNIINKLNYKLSECLLKSKDIKLTYNFLFYMLSTGIIDLDLSSDFMSLIDTIDEDTSIINDAFIDDVNSYVEPVVDGYMRVNNFVEDEDGNLSSKLFSNNVNDMVTSMLSSKEDIDVKEDLSVIGNNINNISNKSNVIELFNNKDKEISNVSRNEEVIQKDYKDQNFIKNIELLYNLESNENKPSISNNEIDDILLRKILNKPIVNWSKEECEFILTYNKPLPKDISRSDVLQRLSYLVKVW